MRAAYVFDHSGRLAQLDSILTNYGFTDLHCVGVSNNCENNAFQNDEPGIISPQRFHTSRR